MPKAENYLLDSNTIIAIIGTAAIVYGLALLSRNLIDFKKIDGLKTAIHMNYNF